MMPGVADSDVDVVAERCGRLDGTLHRLGVAHVGADGDRAPAGRLDLGHDRLGRCGIEVDDDDRGALPGQPPSDCRADPAAGARHERRASVQAVHQ